MLHPRPAEEVAIDHRLRLMREAVRPEHLQVEVVVRNHIGRHRIVIGESERPLPPLVRLAERTACGLPEKASEHLFTKCILAEFHDIDSILGVDENHSI